MSWAMLVVVCGIGIAGEGGLGAGGLQAVRSVDADQEGVLRWGDSGEEVCLFGVNYYPPHMMDFTHLKAAGVSIENTIDKDLAHFVRMGFDTLRLHVFDREISDKEGNLVENEHLLLLDYLIARAKERGIYTVLTPIAWWGTEHSSGGFSDHYSMQEMITSLEARKAQQRYLQQFMDHVNPHTGLAYKDDPGIPVFELINEPQYAPDTSDAQIVEYINALVDAIRDTGCSKPLFYNGWCGRHAAVRDSNIDGCTFGWYPSGLVAGRSLTGNFLPQVNDYSSMRSEELAKKAKIVYEFDAADVPGSYLYAAMARAFRGGGAQIAAQFQYEPLPVAAFNAGWVTHYLNLVHTPRRAVGFLIAGEAFHRIPRHTRFGAYPDSSRFGQFRVSYEEDLAEMISEEAFLYSNDTATQPPAPERLRRVVGCGSSSVVTYEGTGAYFLDRLEPGVWRLEVYPDAVWVADPFSLPVSLDREMSRVVWRSRQFSVRLPDLGQAFRVKGLNEGNDHGDETDDGTLVVGPGVYLLTRPGVSADLAKHERVGRLGLREFVTSPQSRNDLVVRHEPLRETIEGMPVETVAMVVGESDPREVTLHVRREGTDALAAIPMRCTAPYRYTAEIPGEWAQGDTLGYAVSVQMAEDVRSFPWNLPGLPSASAKEPSPVRVLMDGWQGETPAMTPGATTVVPGSREGLEAIRLAAPGFEGGGATGIRFDALQGWSRPQECTLPRDEDWALVVRGRSYHPQTRAVEVGLIDARGNAYGIDIPLSETWRDVRIPLKDLRCLWDTKGSGLAVDDVKNVSLVFGAWLYGTERALPHGLDVERIALAPPSPFWKVPVLRYDAPVVLFDAARHHVRAQGHVRYRQDVVGGSKSDTSAVRVAVEAFDEPPSSIVVRNDIREELALRRDFLPECNVLRIRARALQPYTTTLELVLVEKDGAPWGTNVPLTTEWQDIEVPFSELRFFPHWSGVPKDRGHEGDALRPANIALVSMCFGSWLYPERVGQPHTVEIERIVVCKGDASG